ncbi:bifunctional nuclease family protein [Flavicella marina]|uniref:bifunctional nuclease family protein n=1 Tax=Flavicella marina TaxID=1475951 RepID=UPI0012659A8E|nr:bifunctional nuclease family protein [Flavicella marina]
MSLVQLDIKGISYSQTQSGAYALVLTEIKGSRTLPIIIGAFEAQSIAIALEKEIKPPRPLTHDLFKTFSERFQINILRVIIHKLVDGVFFSSLVCERDGIEEIIDTRTSDAIALAIRFSAPIYTYETILEKAGIFLKLEADDIVSDTSEMELDELLSDTEEETQNPLKSMSLQELHNQLQIAIEQEDYETAAQLRDEISKR